MTHYKKLILEIAKEDDSEDLIFNEELLEAALESFQDRINHFETEINWMKAQEEAGISGATKTLKRWKALANKAQKALKESPKAQRELERLKRASKLLGYELIPIKK